MVSTGQVWNVTNESNSEPNSSNDEASSSQSSFPDLVSEAVGNLNNSNEANNVNAPNALDVNEEAPLSEAGGDLNNSNEANNVNDPNVPDVNEAAVEQKLEPDPNPSDQTLNHTLSVDEDVEMSFDPFAFPRPFSSGLSTTLIKRENDDISMNMPFNETVSIYRSFIQRIIRSS